MKTITHDWDWWAYQFRVIHRRGIHNIDYWDDRLVEFVSNALHLREGERLLDLACGSGVHALRFARRGLEVVGLDISPKLVRYCNEQAAAQHLDNVTFVEGDMRELTFEEEFDALVILSVSFGFFDDETNQRVLDGVARALKTGGRLFIQMADLLSFVERNDNRRYWQEREEGIYLIDSWYDPLTGISYGSFRFLDRDGVLHLWDDTENVRLYTLPEVRRMFDRAGLEITMVYGDVFLQQPYGPDNHHEMIVVGRKPPRDR